MSVEETPGKQEPQPASELALEAAAQIATWCIERRDSAIEDANLQIRTVWILLIGGVVLLLGLPRLVALIDYTGATLPPDALKRAVATLSDLETDEQEMHEALKAEKATLALRQKELAVAKSEKKTLDKAFRNLFEDSWAVWERTGPRDIDFGVTDILQLQDGVMIAAGWENTGRNSKFLLLRSNDGVVWRSISPEEKGEQISGSISSLVQAADGAVIAVGHEATEEGQKIVLLRSSDGDTWFVIRPTEAGDRISGLLWSIAATGDGVLFAAGEEFTVEGTKVIFLRSYDGEEWSVIPGRDPGVRVQGAVYSLALAPDGALIATGAEQVDDEDKVLLLRSPDGEIWSGIPLNQASKRITGALFSITSAPDGSMIVAGDEQADNDDLTLVARSADGKNWSVVHPEENGVRISGAIYAIRSARNGDLIAAGREGPDFYDGNALLLRSPDGNAWSPVRLELNGARPQNGYGFVFESAEGTLYTSTGVTGSGLYRTVPTKSEIVRQLLLDGKAALDFAVPLGSTDLAISVVTAETAVKRADELVDLQQTIQQQAEATMIQQSKVVEEIREANGHLEDALRRTEPMRQASWIGTRLAVVALLFFLVQIVFNRYRYLQRLADFYDGRAQAFRLLADSGPEVAGTFLHSVSLNELMVGLSPGDISFGKAAEPPTQHLMSILQAAIKK